MSKNVYLASRYDRKDEMKSYIPEFNRLGWGVPARWLHTTEQWDGEANNNPVLAATYAKNDLEDINSADIVFCFTEGPEGTKRGGRHVEFGYALALQKPTIIVGPVENIFYSQATYVAPTLAHGLAWLAGYTRR